MKLEVPVPVGVPDISPVEAFKLRPDGSEPRVTAHEYEGVPPAASRLALYAAPSVPSGRLAVVTSSAAGVDTEAGYRELIPSISS